MVEWLREDIAGCHEVSQREDRDEFVNRCILEMCIADNVRVATSVLRLQGSIHSTNRFAEESVGH